MPNDKATDAAPRAPSVRSREADGAGTIDDPSAASAWRKPQMWLLNFDKTEGGNPGTAEWANYGGS